MTKRHNEFESIKNLMNEFIDENNLSKGMDKISVKEAWENLMGPGIVKYTHSVDLNGKTLVVKLNSSVLREELSFGKEKIISMMNQELEKPLINRIILS